MLASIFSVTAGNQNFKGQHANANSSSVTCEEEGENEARVSLQRVSLQKSRGSEAKNRSTAYRNHTDTPHQGVELAPGFPKSDRQGLNIALSSLGLRPTPRAGPRLCALKRVPLHMHRAHCLHNYGQSCLRLGLHGKAIQNPKTKPVGQCKLRLPVACNVAVSVPHH